MTKPPFATTWMNQEGFIFIELIQTGNIKLKQNNIITTTKRNRLTDVDNKLVIISGEGQERGLRSLNYYE